MEHRLPEPRIEAYFLGQMPPSERKSFEDEMRANPALLKAFQTYYLSETAYSLQRQQRLREKVAAIRKEIGPLPKPTLSWKEKIRGRFGLGLFSFVSVSMVLASLLWYANTLPSTCELAPSCRVEPFNPSVAGNRTDDAAEAYFNDPGNAVSLIGKMAETCPTDSFCVALYYLAHAQLRNADLKNASAIFQRLANQALKWPAFVEPEKMRWNAWLCGLCATGFDTKKQQELEAFCQSTDGKVATQANTLSASTSGFLRFLRF